MPWLINAAQVDKFRKSQKALLILDASWHQATTGRNAYTEFLAGHIIGAQFFDLAAFHQTEAANAPTPPHPHMLSLAEASATQKLSALGLRNDYKIILYDNSDLHTACRALWMLKVFGHNPQQLYILDGGLSAWRQYGGKLETGAPVVGAKSYQVTLQLDYLRDITQMKANLHSAQEQVVDVRHAVRYAGGAEPNARTRRGHIPGSFSFPYTTFFDKNNYWKPLEKIRHQFTGISADSNRPIVTTCGSGITAPILNFALDLLGNKQNAMYNGAWQEWGTSELYPGEMTLAERPVITSVEE